MAEFLEATPSESLLNLLSESEQQKFHESLENNTLDTILSELADPWWTFDSFNSSDHQHQLQESRPPPILTPIPPFNTLSRNEPNPRVFYALIDLTLAYVTIWRHFNGAFEDALEEVCDKLLEVSCVLSEDLAPPYAEAMAAWTNVTSLLLKCQDLGVQTGNLTTLMADVVVVLSSSSHLKRALSHLHQLFAALHKNHNSTSKQSADERGGDLNGLTRTATKQKKAFRVSKKLIFFLSLVDNATYSKPFIDDISAFLRGELAKIRSDVDSFATMQRQMQEALPQIRRQARHGRSMIEEL
ncbi:Zinc finger HIT domain-containing protein 2 [Blyttiomyces sp. JEL0837]|nr:Zinc finger HIT domain-containing protein 2 [Blyttiomyces sp. JEL0837]